VFHFFNHRTRGNKTETHRKKERNQRIRGRHGRRRHGKRWELGGGNVEMKVKLIAGVVAIVVIGFAVTALIGDVRVRRMERVVDSAKQQARVSEESAEAAESLAGEYRKKIEYLEGELAAIGQIARRQDEELEKIGGDVNSARRDVERARSIRAIDATADELCAKLAELGHGC
jgi:hypothetical protein